MGYEIFTGHRLESLVTDHLDLFQNRLFGPRPWVVLQNQSLGQWLKLSLAKTLGGYITGDFLFQDEAVRRLIEGSGAAPGRLLFLDDLKYAMYRYLTRVLTRSPEPVFAPLAGSSEGPDPGRLFELADHISGVFHNYAMNSRIWPLALGSGTLPGGSGADPGAFAWQSRLWRDLLDGPDGTLAGLVLDRLTRDPPAPGPGPVPQVVLVGSAFLSRRTTAFLRTWADAGLVEVVHLLLLPAPAATPWPDRRPWSSWGAFGRAFLSMVPPAPGSAPLTAPAPTALGILQDSLTRGVPFPGAPYDGTLTIVSCPHPLRELEVLRDHLLEALGADPGLQVHEIAILAPDINVYAPFLDAAFGSDDPGRNLRYHVIDLDLGRENTWFQALDALLALVSGPVDRPTLFRLVRAPAFREVWQVDDDDQDLWLGYTEEVSAWREEPDGNPGPQTWTSGADRLFSGWFRSEEPGLWPLDTAPSAFGSLGKFQKLVTALTDLGRRTRQPRPFSGWIRFFDGLLADFLAPGEGTGAVLSGRLRTLDSDAGLPGDPMPWAGFRAFVQDQIAHFPGRRGQLLTEGVHCSSLRPLRSIPFKIIAVLGLDEGKFPRQGPVPSFDLMRHEPDQAQVSSLALERYCFWETLMAARRSLHLSYKGRSPVDGSELPPSPVLADLLDYLEEGGHPWPVTQASVKDFAAVPNPGVTWSPRTWRRARAVISASAGTSALDRAPEPVQEFSDLFPEVRTNEVVEAFTVPARFHLRRVRQVVLRDEDRRGVDDEEPWSLGFFDGQAWVQEGIRVQLSGRTFDWDVDKYLDRMAATGRLRTGAFADRDRRNLGTLAVQASGWARSLSDEGWVVEGPRGPVRTLWAGRPWAPEPGDRLVRGPEVRYFRLLYSAGAPARFLWDPALRLLLDPVSQASLDTLNPGGIRQILTWVPDQDQTARMATRAEEYWKETASEPLPFYPDFLEAIARRREKFSGEPWAVTVEEAWVKAREPSFTWSEATFSRCPYAALAFAGEPDWETLGRRTEYWWEDLFSPLLGAWV